MGFRGTPKLKTIFVFALLWLGCSSQASAGLLLEPYAGYQFTTLDITRSNGGSEKPQMMGPTYGARIGLTIPLFFAAIDYSSLNGNIDGWGFANETMIQNQLAAVIGLQIPFLRFLIGYGVMNDLKVQSPGGDKTFSGSSVKAGVSFTGLPFIAVNLEYIMNTYNKVKGPGIDEGIGGTIYSKVANDSIFFSVSLPFDF